MTKKAATPAETVDARLPTIRLASEVAARLLIISARPLVGLGVSSDRLARRESRRRDGDTSPSPLLVSTLARPPPG